MKVYVYIDYYPVKVLQKLDDASTRGLAGEFKEINSNSLPDREFRNYWIWDEDKNKVVIDKKKVKAVADKKGADDLLLAGIKSKLGLTDEEWDVLSSLVKK